MSNLNCDQALLWVATRSRQLVHEASGEWRARQRTWVQSCFEAFDPETGIYGAPFIKSRRAAEAKLLAALAREQNRVTATWDNRRINRRWFLRARFFDFTGPNASFPARLHGGLGLKHVRDKLKVIGPQLADREEHRWPTFDGGEIQRAFPESETPEPQMPLDPSPAVEPVPYVEPPEFIEARAREAEWLELCPYIPRVLAESDPEKRVQYKRLLMIADEMRRGVASIEDYRRVRLECEPMPISQPAQLTATPPVARASIEGERQPSFDRQAFRPSPNWTDLVSRFKEYASTLARPPDRNAAANFIREHAPKTGEIRRKSQILVDSLGDAKARRGRPARSNRNSAEK